MAMIEPRCVSALDPADGSTEVCPGGLDQQVVVVGHQAVAMDEQSKSFGRLTNGIQMSYPVTVVAVCGPSGVAASRDVVTRIFKLDANTSGHRQDNTYESQLNQLSWTDPMALQVIPPSLAAAFRETGGEPHNVAPHCQSCGRNKAKEQAHDSFFWFYLLLRIDETCRYSRVGVEAVLDGARIGRSF